MSKRLWTRKGNRDSELRRPAETITIDAEIIQAYLQALGEKGLEEETQKLYRRKLLLFLHFILPECQVGPDTLEAWSKEMGSRYAAATVNMGVSVVNGLLEWMGYRELQWLGRLKKGEKSAPELTRQEYHRLLLAAVSRGDEGGYLLIKTIAATGLFPQEFSKLTVEAVKRGRVDVVSNGVAQSLRVPPCLQRELLAYAGSRGICSGCVFQTRNGNPIQRNDISMRTRRICQYAGLPYSKGTARSLRKLYLETRKEMEKELTAILEQSYDHLLETEQVTVGWPECIEQDED